MEPAHKEPPVADTGQEVTVMPRAAVIPSPTVSEHAALLAMIERLATNPGADIEKFERLIQMQRQLKADMAKEAFDVALAEMQPKLPIIDKKGRIEVRKKDAQGERTGAVQQSTAYAKWEDINEAITPILSAHGFSLSFRVGTAKDGKIAVTGILARAGHREDTTIDLPHDSTGSKNPNQAVVSTTSYGKRTTATLLLNITTRGEDDDGKAGAGEGGGAITEDQAVTIRKLIDEVGADIRLFCKHFKIEAVPDLPAKRFEEARTMLNAKRRKA